MKKYFLSKKRAATDGEKLLQWRETNTEDSLVFKMFSKHATKECNTGCEQHSCALVATFPLLCETKSYQSKRYSFVNICCTHNKNAKCSILFPCNYIYATDKAIWRLLVICHSNHMQQTDLLGFGGFFLVYRYVCIHRHQSQTISPDSSS